MEESLGRYLDDIRKTALLEAEEERGLFELYRRGSRRARERLIRSHMRFVVKVALHFRNVPMPMADLVSEGALGLIKAIDTYDPSRGVRFISYAVWWIRSHIVVALQTKGSLIRLPANQLLRITRENRSASGDRKVSEEVRAMMELQRPQRVIEEASQRAGEGGPANPESELAAKSISAGVGAALSALPPREAYVVRNLFGIDQGEAENLKELAHELGVSSERVRQIKREALERLKKEPACLELKDAFS
jgi:RNA polymerase primary sigma factor